MIISSSPFSPLPVFKIDYFLLAKQSRNTAFNSLEIWHQVMSSEIQMLGKHVAIHLFKTTCITFPARSAYPCRLSLQFSFHCFPIIFSPTGCLPYSSTLVPDDHQSGGSHSYFILVSPWTRMSLTIKIWCIWLRYMLRLSWQGCKMTLNVVRTSSTLAVWQSGID